MERALRVGDYDVTLSADNVLGSGAFATVYRGRGKHGPVAVKVIEYDSRPDIDKHYLTQEISIMRRINHPNLLKLLAMQKLGSQFFVVVDLCPGGDLKEFMEKQPGRKFDEDTARGFMCQLASGLKYLHENGIIHRDLKPHNILLSEKSFSADVKIADFGFAREVRAQMQSILGSPLYMAPEILQGKTYSSKSDLWSVGCIFYEMLTGKLPFAYVRNMDELRRIAADGRPILSMPTNVSNYSLEILDGLLQKSSHSRWDWKTFFEHPYLQPENLSRSTLELPQATEKPQPQSQPKAQPERPPKPLHYDPTKPNNGWLQHFYIFYPHGQAITLYLRPTHKIESLKRTLTTMTSTSIENQLLLDYEGKELPDSLILSDTVFWKQEIPMYFVRKDLFDSSIRTIPPYKFSDLPHPNLQIPKDAILSPNLSSSDRVRLAYLSYSSEKKEFIQSAYENMKTRNLHFSLCLKHHDCQGRVYKILQNFLVQQASGLKQPLQQCEAQVVDLSKRSQELQANRNATLTKLRNTELSPLIYYAQGQQPPAGPKKTLMEAENESAILTDYQSLPDDLLSLMKGRATAVDVMNQISRQIESLVTSVQDTSPLAKMLAGHDQMVQFFKLAKTNVDQYAKLLTKAQEMLKHLTSNSTLNQVQKFLSVYAEMDLVFKEIAQLHTKVEEISIKLQLDKQQASLGYLATVQTRVGPLFLMMEASKATLTNLAQQISIFAKKCARLEDVTRLHTDYTKALEEALRRASYQQNLQLQVNVQSEKLQQVQIQEATKQKAFTRNYGNIYLAKIFPEFVEDDPKGVPACSMTLGMVDPSLSTIGRFLDENNNHYKPIFDSQLLQLEEERLKKLEKENADIIEVIHALKKKTATLQNVGTVDSSLLVSKLQVELERSTKQLEDLSKQNSKEQEEQQILLLQQRLAEQKKKNLAISEQLERMEKDNQKKKDANVLAEKYKEVLKAEEDAFALAQKKLLECANVYDVDALVSMGYQKEHAQKALLLTNNAGVSAACDWLTNNENQEILRHSLDPLVLLRNFNKAAA